MKFKHIALIAIVAPIVGACSSSMTGAHGITETEAITYTTSINEYDLVVDTEPITYTIDISTKEGRTKLKGLNLRQAEELAVQEAAIINKAARIISPKYSYLKEGKNILRITVFGFPARYRNQ